MASHTSEERDQYDVNYSYRRESESLNTERELPNHHSSGGKPENPHNPHTRQHLHSEKNHFHGESSDRHFLPVDRFYREPRGGRDTDGHQDGDGLSADFELEKRKVSEDPLPTYSGMSCVPREPRVKMAKQRDGGFLMSSPRHLDWESGCSPEGTATRA